jgi:hypothetical protein
MLSQPLFVVGSPRSGTTFLVRMLNQHPAIHITNETRIFVLLKDMIDIRGRHPWLLETPYQEQFAAYARRHAGAWVERFYREELGVTRPIWGDKHPHYADPAVLEGEAGLVPGAAPGSCLRLIRDCLPSAKFVHLHRDPRRVAYSLAQKKWVASLDEGAGVWRRHVEEIIGFFGEIDAERRCSLAYADLLERPQAVADAVTGFLGVTDGGEMAAFLAQERRQPTPLSEPVTDLTAPAALPLSDVLGERVLALSGPRATSLGYGNPFARGKAG